MRILILYLTRDGQTQKVAHYLAEQLKKEHDVNMLSLREQQPDETMLASYELIVIGASIRYGHFDTLLEPFIAQHTALLNQKKSAFFCVNLTARKPNRNTPETNAYTRKLFSWIQWKPDWIEVVAGALRYPRYRWYDRMMIRLIMKMTGGETDTSKEIEYTDWQALSQFAQRLSKLS